MTVDALVLQALHGATSPISPPELARAGSISLSELAASLERLRESGFEIEMRPHAGYELRSSPDRLIADDLWARLSTLGDAPVARPLWREIIVFEETSSTNDLAAQLGRDGSPGGVAIFAEHQTAGRGRFGRAWHSARRRGIWVSFLLRPEMPVQHWGRITTWAAVAAARSIDRLVRQETRIKWPNDLELSGRKVAGLLAETGVNAAGEPFAVLGIGIDVNQKADDFPPELRERASSLREISGRQMDRAELAATLLWELAGRQLDTNSSFDLIISEAARRSSVIGRSIEARVGQSIIRGVAESLDQNGHLRLRTQSGMELLTAGEVTLRM